MSARSWLSQDARALVRDRVRAIEAKTAAEILVTVRVRSAAHRHVELALGALLASVALAIYVYAPVTFNDDVAPPAIGLCFAAGVALGASFDGLKRLCLSRRARREPVALAARAAFVDQRIGSTRARSGVLIYVSLLEREVEVIADVGVAVSDMGASWTEAVAGVEGSIRGPGALEAFGAALDKLGEILAAAMPVAADDVNELPDEVVA